MTRNRKHIPLSGARKSGGGTVVGIFIGIVIGVLMATAVVWFMNVTPTPFVKRTESRAASPTDALSAGGAPLPLPGKPGDSPDKRFQFYDILPGKTDPAPDDKPTAAKVATKSSGPLVLQVGSFQDPKDAENLKATLTLMGVEPVVQLAVIEGKTWHRVRIGPIVSFEELNRIKRDLSKAGMEPTIIKPTE